ncbi:MAG: ribonuclease Y [Dehalococcoidia bacterium]|nr:ribonuclease Y [Dehalococcoidia bacterium]
MNYIAYILIVIALVLGGGVGYFMRQLIANQRTLEARKEARALLEEAATKYKEMLLEAKEEAIRVRSDAEDDRKQRRSELHHIEKRLNQKENSLEHKRISLDHRDQVLHDKEKDIDNLQAELEGLKSEQIRQLEQISGISGEEAKSLLLQAVEQEVKEEASRQARIWEAQVKEDANREAQHILATAIQRCTADVVSETTVSTVLLPSDEMKGRLIGREGRNIRAFEEATGVDLIIDDTPESVTLSSFAPVRREIARIALNKLILDGRIHPARIEEIVKKAQAEVETTIRDEGEKAVYEAGLAGLHPELIKLLGQLKFRTSYGQNVLLHSLEVSYLAGMLADEIGIDSVTARKAGLLHDIGKAVSHEVEGPHALIGADLVKQWDGSAEIAQAVAEHHGEVPTSSVLGFIVAAADAISGARPGARRESLEHYLKRVRDVEEIASSFSGVEKTFAIQAGREIRVLVKPDEVDDLAAIRLARDISKKLEDNLSYPGQIKVMVLRETVAVDYAK